MDQHANIKRFELISLKGPKLAEQLFSQIIGIEARNVELGHGSFITIDFGKDILITSKKTRCSRRRGNGSYGFICVSGGGNKMEILLLGLGMKENLFMLKFLYLQEENYCKFKYSIILSMLF